MKLHTNQVAVPHAYFVQARREYRNWRQAWVREVVQNAVDAGADMIEFFTGDYNKGRLMVRDNGSGMTRDVLLNKFLCLGGSQKAAGSTGGFGYAKTLICFSWPDYRIVTGDMEIEGSGGSYSISRHATKFDGTEISVATDQESNTIYAAEIERYLDQCALSGVEFKINGMPYAAGTLRKGETARHQKFDITLIPSVEEGRSYHQVTIRKNGLCMWSSRTEALSATKYDIVVDVLEASTTAFTANRDGFQGERASLLADLVSDRVSTPEIARRKPTKGLEDMVFTLNIQSAAEEAAFSGEVAKDWSRWDAGLGLGEKVARLPSNFIVRCFSYTPRSLNLDGEITRADLKQMLGHRYYRGLAHAWHGLVDAICSTDYARRKFEGKKIMSGLMFGNEGVEGLCVRSGVEYHVLITSDYFDGNKYHADLLDVALHECAHIAHMNHGEEFTMIENGLRRALRQRIGGASLDVLADKICEPALKGRPVSFNDLYPED